MRKAKLSAAILPRSRALRLKGMSFSFLANSALMAYSLGADT
jgi:hypothetical protein